MYFPEPFYGYAPQGRFYHSNMIAQQGHAFLAERPFNSPPPCFYSNHKEHPFPERTVASTQAVSTQNSYQPYNLPQSHVQRRQVVREEPAITTQELSPRVVNSLPVYFRVKPSFTNHNGRRCRKSRTVFTELQLRILEKTFSEHKYLDTTHRSKIAHTLSLNETQVKTWFQNRRMKWKRESPDNATTVERAKRKDCDSRKANDQENHITLMASY